MFKSEVDYTQIILTPGQRVKYDDVYYILKQIDNKCNSAPLGMLWLCKEKTPTVSVGVVNVFTKMSYFGDMSNLIANVESIDNLLILHSHLFPVPKLTFWQKIKSLFA